jgi:DNA-binding beta-propeller fold protein YncE
VKWPLPRSRRGAIGALLALLAACLAPAAAQPAAPLQPADPSSLLLIVEDAGRRLSLLDGERLEPIHRISPQLPVQGEPKFTPDGQYAFFRTQGGWITKVDLRQFGEAARVRAGSDVRGLAVSADGRWVLAGNAEPQTVALFDAQLNPVRTWPAATLDGETTSPVGVVFDTGPRKSFIVSFEAMAQLWEISYDPRAEAIFDGLVHDYRMGEAIAQPGFLGVRRVPLDRAVDIVGFDPPRRNVLAAPRQSGDSAEAATLDVVNLDVRRRIAQLPLGAIPNAVPVRRGAAAFTSQGRQLVALSGRADGIVRIADPATWSLVRTVDTGHQNLVIRAHPNARHLWVSSAREGLDGVTLTLVDKATLAIDTVLTVPGGPPVHMAFSRDGGRAFIGSGGGSGALAVYDTRTLALVKRLPISPPAAAYPVMGWPQAGP